MGNTQEIYQIETLRILTQFQRLEQSLKMYISEAYALIESRAKGFVPFRYSGADVESFSLERLIGIFAKVNDNHTLIARLNKLPKKRNDVAHRSLLIAWGGYSDLKKQKNALSDYSDLEAELTPCLRDVLDEWGKLGRTRNRYEA